MVGVSSYLIQHGVALGLLLVVGIVSSAVYFLWRARAQVAGRAGQMLARLLALMAIPLTYSVLFEQFSLSINLFIDRMVDRKIGVFTVAAPQLLSLNAFFVLLFLPLLGAGWAALERRGREPATSQKFALGFAFIAAGFWLLSSASGMTSGMTGGITSGMTGGMAGGMAGGMTSGITSEMTNGLVDAVGKVPMLYVVLAYLLITLGELCIAPLSYATVGRIVPEGLQGLAMGMLLLAFALGILGASWLATAAAIPDGMLAAASGEVYRHFFMVPAAIALVAVPVCLAASRLLDRTVPT
jgi:POT family proton-dependent oligopeptide transporter